MLALNSQEIDDAQSLRDFEHASAEEILQWAFKNVSPDIALACSFQAESSVLIDMLYQLRGTDFRVFTLDTGRMNQETYECMEALRQRYAIAIEVYFPAAEKVEQMVKAHGGILKINPLADWTYKQVWDYIAAHELPYNKLHDRSFSSIGCAPCTRAIKPW